MKAYTFRLAGGIDKDGGGNDMDRIGRSTVGYISLCTYIRFIG